MNDPYATHIPVLESIGSVIAPRTILEMGCGKYSTPLFCDPNVYPDASVFSWDTDGGWIDTIQKQLGKNAPKSMVHVLIPMARYAEYSFLEPFELIFVDDSDSLELRSSTIRTVAKKKLKNSIVVIHDYEQPLYQEAAEDFEHILVYTNFVPHTAIAWNGNTLSKQNIRSLKEQIELEQIR